MKYNPLIHNRKSIRLKGYDYSQSGAYFITICTNKKENIFGEIINDLMVLNEKGKIIQNEWEKTNQIRPEIIIDEYIIMPDHIHGIIIISNPVGVNRNSPQIDNNSPSVSNSPQIDNNPPNVSNTPQMLENINRQNKLQSPKKTIGSIVRGFKSTTTKQINLIRNTYDESLWQRDYYDRIIRDEEELNAIRKYIQNNPLNWAIRNTKKANNDK